MKRAVMLGAVAAVLLSVGVGAQGRNFSGVWVIDSEKTAASGGGTVAGGGGGVMTRSIAAGSTAGAAAVSGGAGGGGGAVAAGGGSRARSGGSGVAPGVSVTMDANAFTLVNGATTTTYKLDGSVTNIENPRGKVSAKASWQGDRITIESTSETPNGVVTTHASWYLEGEYLVRENKSTSPDGQEVIRKTYYKRS
jgi:type IV secretion system protein TrbL